MIINNGVISRGNNNTINFNEYDYDKIINEIKILKKYVNEKEIDDVLQAAMKKDNKKITVQIKKLSKKALDIIEKIGLNVLSNIINKNIFK